MMATPVFGQRSGWHEDLLAGQLRADSVLLNSPILGLGSRIGRATDGVPLELALSKIVTPARLQPPSTRSGTDVASLLGSSSLLKSVPGTPAGTFTNSERQGAGDGATSTTSTGSRETPSQNKESKNGLSVFQAHTSALRAQLQDLHQSLEVPRAGWDKVEAHTVLAGTHSASAFASLSTFDGVAAAALAKPLGRRFPHRVGWCCAQRGSPTQMLIPNAWQPLLTKLPRQPGLWTRPFDQSIGRQAHLLQCLQEAGVAQEKRLLLFILATPREQR